MLKLTLGEVYNQLIRLRYVKGISGDGKSELLLFPLKVDKKYIYKLVLDNSKLRVTLYETEDVSDAELSQIATIFISLVRQ